MTLGTPSHIPFVFLFFKDFICLNTPSHSPRFSLSRSDVVRVLNIY